jgi:hypothetical protein
MNVFETTEAEPIMAPKPSETGYGSLQPTSYWSVPEQRDFPRLLAHFGRDFEGISNFMKTKTTVMVSKPFICFIQYCSSSSNINRNAGEKLLPAPSGFGSKGF